MGDNSNCQSGNENNEKLNQIEIEREKLINKLKK